MNRRSAIRQCARSFRRRIGSGIGLLAAACLGACATRTEPEIVAGNLDVLSPFFAEARMPDPRQWVVLGTPDFVPMDSEPSLRFATTSESYLVARHVDAPLKLAPFLGWVWNTEDSPPDFHPIRLAVGFRGPGESARVRHGGLTVSSRSPLPDYDRVIEIAWGRSALERGHLSIPEDRENGPKVPVYVARGGVENTAKWWREAVDLSEIYGRLWPEDNRDAARIVFVGFVSDAAPRTGLRIAGLKLSR